MRRSDHFRVDLSTWLDEDAATPPPLRAGAVLVGYSRDLAVGGMCVAVPSPLPPGHLLRVKIAIQELDAPLDLVAEVVRSRPMSKGGFELGLRFAPQWISEASREALETFLYAP